MKDIALVNGKGVAIVDDTDYERLRVYRWYHAVNRYACRSVRVDSHKRSMVYMHHDVLSPREGYDIDHINGNGLDNRRRNLRHCSRSENIQNQAGHRNATSRYKGVSWDKEKAKWLAQIRADAISAKRRFLGYHENEEEAARAYDAAARELRGKFAWTNFPKGEEPPKE